MVATDEPPVRLVDKQESAVDGEKSFASFALYKKYFCGHNPSETKI
jgi:hypothetical protein